AIDGVEYIYTITGDINVTNQADNINEMIESVNDVTITATAVMGGYSSEETTITVTPRQYLCNITDITEGDGEVTLTWEEDSEANAYQVLYYHDGIMDVGGNSEETSLTVDGLTNNEEYQFLVMPLIDDIYVIFDNKNDTDKAHFVTAIPHYTPDMPEVLVKIGEYRIEFNADAIDGVTYVYSVTDTETGEVDTYEGEFISLCVDRRYYTGSDPEIEFRAKAVCGLYESEEFVFTGSPRKFVCDAEAVATSDSVTLTWEEDYDADSYEVYLYDGAEAELVGETEDTEYTVEGLEPETEYGFYVLPVIEDVNILFGPDLAYDAPHILYVTTKDISPVITSISPGNHCAKVRWNTLPDASLYRLTYMIDDVPVRTMEYTAESNATMVKGVYNLDNGTEYGFYVTAYIGGRWTTAQNVSYAVPDDYNIASTVTLSGGTVTITWDMAEGAELYQIYEWNRDNNSQKQITSTRSNSVQIYINTAQNGEMWFAVQPKYTSFGYPFFRPEADNTDFSYEHHVTWTDGVIKIDP
ncbi:MAG: fibronectin type III domain-containing protein, partial [Oscillospiraceae bacterium]|nr:fibronectin type III domain-containing protein [Oscillospiraceae bacterium]